jgi:magnesium chelatase family protein
MLARTRSLGLIGIDAYQVEVEVSMSARGLPTFSMVGLPDSAVRESRQRVFSAIASIGVVLPSRKTTVNLAPAGLRKEGPGFDLPIAVGILSAAGVVPEGEAGKYFFTGELSLDGRIRPVRGILPMADTASRMNHSGMVVPAANADEAALAGSQDVYPVDHLSAVVDLLQGCRGVEAHPGLPDSPGESHSPCDLDLSDVRGQEQAKRALEVAAAGGHNLLMIGPPGSGKTMLARRIPSILPPMVREEAIETTKLHSVCGFLAEGQALVSGRPFRAPHHTISDAGLIGGGPVPRPGEVSLADNGVLFLDELPEFRRNVLEVLRQPLEDGYVTIARAAMSVTYPARFMLAAAMNPCPCGYLTDPGRSCNCTAPEIQNYLNRISGPLMDRIDIHLEVAPVSWGDLSRVEPTGETSATVRERVGKAREMQVRRFPGIEGVFSNSGMTGPMIRELCPLDRPSGALLRTAMERFGFSARAYDRVIKVSRTIADLAGEDEIAVHHVSEAIQYRALDRDYWT